MASHEVVDYHRQEKPADVEEYNGEKKDNGVSDVGINAFRPRVAWGVN